MNENSLDQGTTLCKMLARGLAIALLFCDCLESLNDTGPVSKLGVLGGDTACGRWPDTDRGRDLQLIGSRILDGLVVVRLDDELSVDHVHAAREIERADSVGRELERCLPVCRQRLRGVEVGEHHT